MSTNDLIGEVVGGEGGLQKQFMEFARSADFQAFLNQQQAGYTTTSGALPVGAITAYGPATAPAGWLLCDGSSYTPSQYPALYAAIATQYGGTAGANFNVPDLRGRVAVGVGAAAGRTARTLNQQGGSENAVVVSHNHGGGTGSMNRNNPHGHNDHNILRVYGAAGSQQGMLYESRASRDWVHGFVDGHSQTDINHEHAIGTDGEDGTGKNMPPFVVINYIIKAV